MSFDQAGTSEVMVSFTFDNITNPIANAALYAIPEGITSALPWWTPFPGAILDLFIAIKTVTMDWRQDMLHVGPEDWTKPLTAKDKGSMAFMAVEVSYMLIQMFAGFAYYGQYSWRREFLRYGGAVSYVLPFAAATKLWARLIFRNLLMKISAWVLALFTLLLFILLHLPNLGGGPLYELWAPGCIPFDNVTATEWECTNSTNLQLGWGDTSDSFMPKPVDWAFAGVMGAFLFWTAVKHIKYTYTKQPPAFQQRIAGSIMGIIIVFVLTMTILAFWANTAFGGGVDDESWNDLRDSLLVCPGVANNTLMDLQIQDGNVVDTRCVIVNVDLPIQLPSLKAAVAVDKANVARLIFNF